MKATGWEIKPFGWIVLIALVGLTIYFVFKTIKKKWFPDNQQE